MRAMYTIALIPIPVFGGAWIMKPAPQIKPRPVISEPILAARQDANTFRIRWAVIADMPPATVVHYASEEREGMDEIEQVQAPRHRPNTAKSRKNKVSKDLCARHNMRTVHYGRRWRCRR